MLSALDFPNGAPAPASGVRFVTGRRVDGRPTLDPPHRGASIDAALAGSDQGFADLSALAARLRADHAIAIPDPVRADPSPEGLSAAIIASLAADLADARVETVSLAGALARMRINHAQLQDSFALLEAIVQARGLASPGLAFAEAPTGWISLAEEDGLAPVSLAQRLPLSPYGLAAFGLSLDGDAADLAGWRLSLHHPESGATLGSWRLAPRQTRGAWSVFALPRALALQIGTLELKLIRVSPGSRGPVVGVADGVANPIHACRLAERTGATHALDQALALRLWTLTPDASAEDVDFASALTLRLPAGALAKVRPVRPAPGDGGAIYVHAREDENALFCHPAESGPALACLGAVIPPEAARVLVTAALDHPEARTVEFALVLAPDDAAAEAGLAGAEWSAVQARATRSLSLDVPPGLDRRAAHLYVATRMQAGASNQYAWAMARDIRFALSSETRR